MTTLIPSPPITPSSHGTTTTKLPAVKSFAGATQPASSPRNGNGHPVHATLNVQPVVSAFLTDPATQQQARLQRSMNEEKNQAASTSNSSSESQLTNNSSTSHFSSSLPNPTRTLLPSGRSSLTSHHPQSAELTHLTTPHRPPVTSIIDPRAVRPATSGSVHASGAMTERISRRTSYPERLMMDEVDTLQSRLHVSLVQNRKLIDSQAQTHAKYIATQRDLERWTREVHSLEENNAQLKYLYNQAASRELELSVLRRESNTYKDADVESLIAELTRTRQQLKLAEEDISTLLNEKKVALKAATAARRVNESAETRAADAEQTMQAALKQAKEAKETLTKTVQEYDDLVKSIQDLEQRNTHHLSQLTLTKSSLESVIAENNHLKGVVESHLSEKDAWNHERRTCQSELDGLRLKNEDFYEKWTTTARQLEEEKERFVDMKTQKEELQRELKQLIKKKDEVDTSLSTLQGQHTALQAQLVDTRRDMTDVQEKLRLKVSQLENERILSQQTIGDLNASIVGLKNDLAQLELKHQESQLREENLGASLNETRDFLKQAEDREAKLQDDLRSHQSVIRTKDTDISGLQTQVLDHLSQIAALRTKLTNTENEVMMSKTNLAESMNALQSNSASITQKQKELQSLKQQVQDLRTLSQELTKQLDAMKDNHAVVLARMKEEQSGLLTDLQRERALTAHQAQMISGLELKRKSAEERLEATQNVQDTFKHEYEEKLEEAQLKHIRLERLYEDTCSQMTSYSTLQSEAHQRFLDEIASQKGQIEVLQAHLLAQKHDEEVLQTEYERLIHAHRSLNATSISEHKRLLECELKVNELTQVNKMLTLQANESAAALNKRATLNLARSSLGGGVSSATSPTNAGDSAPILDSRMSLTRRGSFATGQLGDNLVKDAMDTAATKKINTELKTQIEELKSEVSSLRAGNEKMFQTSELWRQKYEQMQAQYDELYRKTSATSQRSNSMIDPIHLTTAES